ncbi:MAG: phosphoglycerate dehydrogenase [Elusimicrobiota bacterium]
MSTVCVASRSFSKHPVLRAELTARYPSARFNDTGATLKDESLVSFLLDCEKAILALEVVDDTLLARLPKLKLISKFGVGLDSVDLKALERRKVKLSWTPGTNSRSVAELALMGALALLRRFPETSQELRDGTWRQLKGSTLTGKTVGLVGLGAVGREFVSLLAPMTTRILAHDMAPDRTFAEARGVRLLPLVELLRESDVVSLHLPLTEQTKNLIDASHLDVFKPTAVLINTARGGLVDEDALIKALDSERLAGAFLDAFSSEPPSDPRLLNHPKILATPHVGGSTEEAILAMGRAAIAGLGE